MDIRVGRPPTVGSPGETAAGNTGAVEARVLGVREPRRRSLGRPPSKPERREAGAGRDPLTGRVLILLIPDGSQLPDGIESGTWRVFLRFARR